MPSHTPNQPPLVGITTDLVDHRGSPRAQANMTYADAVHRAGGLAVLLLPDPDQIAQHAALCDAIVLTGGDDPRTEPFGEPSHPAITPVHPARQAYETALLEHLAAHAPDLPVLGICLGMQMMALVARGRLDQHLPDTHADADAHWDHEHRIVPEPADAPCALPAGTVWSRHRQAIDDPGALTVLARAPDSTIEAVADPARLCYLGVQWHPERTADDALGQCLFDQLIGASRPDTGVVGSPQITPTPASP